MRSFIISNDTRGETPLHELGISLTLTKTKTIEASWDRCKNWKKGKHVVVRKIQYIITEIVYFFEGIGGMFELEMTPFGMRTTYVRRLARKKKWTFRQAEKVFDQLLTDLKLEL